MCFDFQNAIRITDRFPDIAPDPRVRRLVWPVRIVSQWGNVQGMEHLLISKEPQITTNEPTVAMLSASDDNGEAGFVLDFGRELHGGVRLSVFTAVNEVVEKTSQFGADEEAYVPVRLTFGESVAEAMSSIGGDKNATNDHSLRDFTVRLPSFSDQEFGETGFRFLCVRLTQPGATLRLKAVAAVFIYRELPYLGSFSCSDSLLNEIYDTAAYTCHLNMQKHLWDGIKRDRLVWVGDMHPEMLTIRTVFGCCGVMEEAIRFARDTTPLPGWMNQMPAYSLWWLLLVHDWYQYSGSSAFLKEHKSYVCALARQVAETIASDGSDVLEPKFLDWPTKDTPAGDAGVRGLMVLALEAAAVLADYYGEPSLAVLCCEKTALLRRQKEVHHGAKQTAAMLALARLADVDDMADHILANGANGFSTFMSYYCLTVAARRSVNGAFDLLRNYYGGMLRMGATTFWEDFDVAWMENATPITAPVPEGKRDIHGDCGAYCYQGFRHSLCHGWASAPTAFLSETVLGIHIEEAGCTHIRLAPQLGDLAYATGTYPTPLGLLTVSHTRRPDGTIETEYDAPVGMQVTVEELN